MRCQHCEELEEQVAQLKADFFGHRCTLPPALALRLTPSQKAILQTLLRWSRPVPYSALIEATRICGWALHEDVSALTIKAQICKMRPLLSEFGVSVANVWGFGYRLTDEGRARLKAMMDEPASPARAA